MGKNQELVRQYMTKFSKEVRAEVDRRAMKPLQREAEAIVDLILDIIGGWHDITGNARNSFAIALYHDKKLAYVTTTARHLLHPPTRETLVRGEAYDRPLLWNGEPNEQPFVATDGDSHILANQEANRLVRTVVPTHPRWSFVVLSRIDYIQYIESRKNYRFISDVADELHARGGFVSALISL